MKKNILSFILIINFYYSIGVCTADEDKTAVMRLGDLIQLEKQTVKTYEGYRFNVNWVGGKPMIDIIQQQVDLIQNKVNMNTILLVKTKSSPSEESETAQELTSLKNFKPSKYVQVDGEKYGDEDDQLLRFDAYDDQGRLRASQWRESQNGINVESVFYTEDGKLISLFYYDKLHVNQPFSYIYSGKIFTTKLEHAIDKFGPLDNYDPQEVVRLCKMLLDKALSKSGIQK